MNQARILSVFSLSFLPSLDPYYLTKNPTLVSSLLINTFCKRLYPLSGWLNTPKKKRYTLQNFTLIQHSLFMFSFAQKSTSSFSDYAWVFQYSHLIWLNGFSHSFGFAALISLLVIWTIEKRIPMLLKVIIEPYLALHAAHVFPVCMFFLCCCFLWSVWFTDALWDYSLYLVIQFFN